MTVPPDTVPVADTVPPEIAPDAVTDAELTEVPNVPPLVISKVEPESSDPADILVVADTSLPDTVVVAVTFAAFKSPVSVIFVPFAVVAKSRTPLPFTENAVDKKD